MHWQTIGYLHSHRNNMLLIYKSSKQQDIVSGAQNMQVI